MTKQTRGEPAFTSATSALDSPGHMPGTQRSVRIVHVITGLQRAGAEMMLYKLLKGLGPSAKDHAVISLHGMESLGGDIQALGVPVHSLNVHLLHPRYVIQFSRILRDLDPGIIHGWMYRANLLSLLGRRLSARHVPLIWGVRAALDATHPHPAKTMALIRLGIPLSSLPVQIVYNSRTAATQHEQIGYNRKLTRVIPNGFDCETFHPSDRARQTVRNELELPQDALLIGLIARYDATKDFETFCAALTRVLQSRPDVYAVMAGRNVTPQNPAIAQLLARHGIPAHRVRLLGERSDIALLFAAFDVSCSSSLTEAFSNSIGESMACGVPCVVTDVGDSAYLVRDTGRVVPPATPDALASALLELLTMPSSHRTHLGVLARQRIETHFSVPHIVEEYNRLYQEVQNHQTGRL